MSEIKCPKCGNDGKGKRAIFHVELVPVYRRVEGVKRRSSHCVYFLDYEDSYDATEDSKPQAFKCGECDEEWNIPRKSIFLDAHALEGSRLSSMTKTPEKV